MKRYGQLWEQVVSFENLLLALKKAQRGKKFRDEVARFTFDRERQLFNLQAELINHQYYPREYRLFTIYERKPRQISAADFRDRVVHHALMNIVEPLLDKRFIYDTYACRKSRGVHLAVSRYQQWSKRYSYVLKLDISRYFPNIDHQIIKQQIRHHIKDNDVLWLFDTIIDSSPKFPNEMIFYFPNDDLLTPMERRKGLPIGNLTSQFLANLYLNGLDHFIKQKLKAKAYIRYVDDFILLSESKDQLRHWQEEIEKYLIDLRLVLHPKKVNIYRAVDGVDVLGYRVFPHFCLLRNDNGHRFKRKLETFSKGFSKGQLDWCDINPSVQSWIGHAGQADTLGLRKSIFNTILFSRE